ncbi:hypothetical protein AAG570_004216 [Ranatra chinensis]|uniref:DUF4789 domain-containing protein n=1 Tax=Ranatra chinensis TaxID=642074 RepID=A0ABD0YFP7_9HEMI
MRRCLLVFAVLLVHASAFPNRLQRWPPRNQRTRPQAPPKVYTPEERKCFQEAKVHYGGSCWDLLRRGPCAQGQWLVLDPLSAPDAVPKCARKPCANDQVLWPDDGLCRPEKNQTVCLKSGTTLGTDHYGMGTCNCISKERVIHSDGVCYFLYKKGPCKAGSILVQNKEGDTVCQRDPCFKQNAMATNSTYVQWEDTKQCFPLESRGPCVEGKVLRLIPWRGAIECTDGTQDHILIDIPSECDGTDQDGNCANRIQVEEQGEKYLADLINSGKKQKRKF